jgi:hypothetical protein
MSQWSAPWNAPKPQVEVVKEIVEETPIIEEPVVEAPVEEVSTKKTTKKAEPTSAE